MDTGQKLNKVLDTLKLSVKDFSQSVGLTASSVTDIRKGRTKNVSGAVRLAIEYKFNVSIKWWDDSTESMFLNKPKGAKEHFKESDTATSMDTVAVLRKQEQKRSKLLKDQINELSIKLLNLEKATSAPQKIISIQETSTDHDKTKNIPLLLGAIAAGHPSWTSGEIEDSICVSSKRYPENDLFAVRVKGDSMIQADIFEGNILIFRKVKYIRQIPHGTIVVASIQDDYTIKELHRTDDGDFLMPRNPRYSMRKIGKDGDSIHGVLVGKDQRVDDEGKE